MISHIAIYSFSRAKNEKAAAAAAATEAARALSDDDVGESYLSRRERIAVVAAAKGKQDDDDGWNKACVSLVGVDGDAEGTGYAGDVAADDRSKTVTTSASAKAATGALHGRAWYLRMLQRRLHQAVSPLSLSLSLSVSLSFRFFRSFSCSHQCSISVYTFLFSSSSFSVI